MIQQDVDEVEYIYRDYVDYHVDEKILDQEQILPDDIVEVLSDIVVEVGLENAYPWNNTAEFKPDSDIIIKMATDATGGFEIYGIISAEYGPCGMLLMI